MYLYINYYLYQRVQRSLIFYVWRIHAAAIHMHFHRRTSVVRNGLFFVYLIRNEVSQYERWVGLLPALQPQTNYYPWPLRFYRGLTGNRKSNIDTCVPQGLRFKINHYFDRLYFSSSQLNRIGLKTNITALKIDSVYIQCVWKNKIHFLSFFFYVLANCLYFIDHIFYWNI